jgi:hypothetical protein
MEIVTKRRPVDTHNRGAAKALGRGSRRRGLSRYSSGVSRAMWGFGNGDRDVFKTALVLDTVALRPRKCA